uniref:Ascorbate-specific PTS system EIIA component n=2 Tax=Ignisphaera aggregans TaxID=334771 RepID=A0A7C5UX72_9CREN
MSSEHLDIIKAIGNRISITKSVKNWVDAVKLTGRMLIEDGVVEERYIDAMIEVVEELGPYIAIAPGVAIPHARPEDGAKEIGLGILIVKDGVMFGSPNDPVYVVIAFAAKDKTSHLGILKELAELLSMPSLIDHLRNASSLKEVVEIIKTCLSMKNNSKVSTK